jgi:methylated-DNA-[protein]-cysteine S-methyltransferase
MPEGHFSLFDTAFGRCALAWSDRGLVAVRLPDLSEALTRANLLARRPGLQEAQQGWPDFVVQAVASVQAHLAGDARDLRQVPLDWRGVHDFESRVYRATRALDPGQTCTYGEMAHALGEPAALRAVGQALGHNPWPLVVPCHRVLAAGGRLGGFSAPGGSETKRRLLVLEAAMVKRDDQLF